MNRVNSSSYQFCLSCVVDFPPEAESFAYADPEEFNDARYGIFSPAILKFQSGLLFLYHMVSYLSGRT